MTAVFNPTEHSHTWNLTFQKPKLFISSFVCLFFPPGLGGFSVIRAVCRTHDAWHCCCRWVGALGRKGELKALLSHTWFPGRFQRCRLCLHAQSSALQRLFVSKPSIHFLKAATQIDSTVWSQLTFLFLCLWRVNSKPHGLLPLHLSGFVPLLFLIRQRLISTADPVSCLLGALLKTFLGVFLCW